MQQSINRERLIRTFTELAEISSPSWKEKEVMNYIVKKFRELDIKHKKFRCGKSFNLLGYFPGEKSSEPIILSAHMDTVVPCEKVTPIITEKKIISDGTTILGSDDKAAIAMFLEAVEVIRENNIPHGPLEILITCAEEQGLQGIKNFNTNILKSKMAFVFDSDGPVGRIVSKAAYHSSLEITINGKASHAGMAPEKGINAITALAEIISLLPAGRIDEETTINTGLITGGKATNIVPDQAWCKLEIRSINEKKMLSIEKNIKQTVKTITSKHKAKFTIKRKLEYPGFTIAPESRISKTAELAMKRIKLKPVFVSSGGGSDTNILNKAGIAAINLSCGMQKVHSNDEFITIKDLIKGAELTLSIIQSVHSD